MKDVGGLERQVALLSTFMFLDSSRMEVSAALVQQQASQEGVIITKIEEGS